MAAPLQPESETTPAWKWGLVWTMFLATMLNYMDRQTMGSASKFIKIEFNLDEKGYGTLESYFGMTFAFTQLISGTLADRFNIKWVYAGAVLIWSAAGFLTGITETLVALYACRILLGFGEAFNWVCATGIVQRTIPRASRGLANAIYHGGASVGAALTPFLALILVAENGSGWRHLFMVVGAMGLIWVALWCWILRGERAAEVSHPAANDAEAAKSEMPLLHIFALRTFWIALGVGISVNVIWHMYRVWLPRIADVEFHLTQAQTQYALAAFFIIADLGGIFTGWILRRLIHGGMPAERAWRIALSVAAIASLFSGTFAHLKDPLWAMAGFCLIGACAMGMFSIFYSMSQEVSGPQTSRILGFIGFVIWVVISLIHPKVGAWVDKTKDFKPVFELFGLVPLLGVFSVMFWKTKTAELKA